MSPMPELNGATERFLIDGDRDAKAAGVAIVLADAAGHAADALPELLILSRGGPRFDARLRSYLNEITHCLASALEAALIASHDAELAGIGAARRAGEDDLAAAATAFLDQARA